MSRFSLVNRHRFSYGSADAVKNPKPTRRCNPDALTAVPATDCPRPDARDLDDASVLTVRVRLS